MRTHLAVLVLTVAACAASDAARAPAAAQQRAGPDAASSTGAGALTCDASDRRLRACYTFDGDTKDRSSYGNHANSARVTYVRGKAGRAVRLGADSRVLVAQHPSLDLTAMTIKAWIRPASFPTAETRTPGGENRMGIIDGEATYRMYLHENGIVRCSITGRPDAYSTVGVPLGEWTRVACTFDGAVMRIHFNGAPVVEVKQAGKIAASIASMAIGHDFVSGDNFIGEIDHLELWDAVVEP